MINQKTSDPCPPPLPPPAPPESYDRKLLEAALAEVLPMYSVARRAEVTHACNAAIGEDIFFFDVSCAPARVRAGAGQAACCACLYLLHVSGTLPAALACCSCCSVCSLHPSVL
jgi:hypothetical protein